MGSWRSSSGWWSQFYLIRPTILLSRGWTLILYSSPRKGRSRWALTARACFSTMVWKNRITPWFNQWATTNIKAWPGTSKESTSTLLPSEQANYSGFLSCGSKKSPNLLTNHSITSTSQPRPCLFGNKAGVRCRRAWRTLEKSWRSSRSTSWRTTLETYTSPCRLTKGR